MSKKNNFIISLLIFAAIIGGYLFSINSKTYNQNISYTNETFGLNVALPESWKGYTVSIDTWTGNKIDDELGEVAYATGSVVSIHNPKQTAANTYQDIPIMVFTLSQWNDLQADKFHIGAAPIGPSELARNSKYIFALPARYNYSFPLGYEEVDKIIRSKPITTFNVVE